MFNYWWDEYNRNWRLRLKREKKEDGKKIPNKPAVARTRDIAVDAFTRKNKSSYTLPKSPIKGSWRPPKDSLRRHEKNVKSNFSWKFYNFFLFQQRTQEKRLGRFSLKSRDGR